MLSLFAGRLEGVPPVRVDRSFRPEMALFYNFGVNRVSCGGERADLKRRACRRCKKCSPPRRVPGRRRVMFNCSAKATAMVVGLETAKTIGMPARPAF